MEVGSPEWIEASLAKLDELEGARAEHETALDSVSDAESLKHHSDALDRLDVEIKNLYAQLEQYAGDEEDEEDESEPDAPPVAVVAVTVAVVEPAPVVAARPVVHAPAAAAPASVSTASSSGFDAPAMSSMSSGSGDDDLKPHGGGAKWAFLGVVIVAGLSVGAFFMWKNMEAEKAKKQAKPEAGESVKIDAAAIPEDTESPNAAKGGDAKISPTANGQPSGSGDSGGGGGTGGGSKPPEGKKKKPIELKPGSDPLGGSSDPLG